MSVVSLVMNHAKAEGRNRLVLLALAQAVDTRNYSQPTPMNDKIANLAKMTRLPDGSVSAALAELQDAGEVDILLSAVSDRAFIVVTVSDGRGEW